MSKGESVAADVVTRVEEGPQAGDWIVMLTTMGKPTRFALVDRFGVMGPWQDCPPEWTPGNG